MLEGQLALLLQLYYCLDSAHVIYIDLCYDEVSKAVISHV